MATYGAGTNVDNERKYLNDLISKGGGNAEWAKGQMNELDGYAASIAQAAQKQSAPKEVNYYNSDGVKNTGYNVGGKTYKDQSGTQRIEEGSYVNNPDGSWWKLTAKGGVQANMPDFAKTLSTYGSYENMLSDIPYPTGISDNMKNMQGQVGDLVAALQSYKPTDSMSRDESQARANSQLNNIYNKNLEKQLDNYNRDAVSRGMFGQLPTEALKQNAISENEVNKAAAIGDLANNLFTQDFNMARQMDSDYYNRQNALLNAVMQGYGIESDIVGNQKNDFVNISNLANNEKMQGYEKALTKLNTLGYADEEIANILGVPVGTPSEQINLLNIQDKMQKDLIAYQSKFKTANGGSGASKNNAITMPQRLDIWQQAVNMLTKEEPVIDSLTGRVTGYNKAYPSYDEVNALYLQLIGSLGYDPYDLMLLQELQSSNAPSQSKKSTKVYTNPVLDAIRSETGAKFWGY